MKRKLAINGGRKIINLSGPHYVWPEIDDKTLNAVKKQLKESISIYNKSGIIEKLENRFSRYHKTKNALLTNSGTSALHSLFVGADLKKGDEIICPAYTFYATITPIFFTGATPILADCGIDGNIDPAEIKKKISPRTKAVIITHIWGIPCDMDKIVKICKENNLLLFEDASHAHFAKYKGKLVGTFGDASAFSLQGQKTLTGGEGGILLTNNDEIFYRALLFGHYNKRCKTEIPKKNPLFKFAVTGMGLKLRIHPVAAAIANEQFDKIPKILKNRRKYSKKIIQELKGLPGLEMPNYPSYVEPTWYAFVMQYKSEELGGLPIEKFYKALVAEGCKEMDIPGSTCPLNLHHLFQNPSELFPDYKINYKQSDFPNSEKFYKNALKLPMWHRKEDEKTVDLYIKAIKKVIKNYKEVE